MRKDLRSLKTSLMEEREVWESWKELIRQLRKKGKGNSLNGLREVIRESQISPEPTLKEIRELRKFLHFLMVLVVGTLLLTVLAVVLTYILIGKRNPPSLVGCERQGDFLVCKEFYRVENGKWKKQKGLIALPIQK